MKKTLTILLAVLMLAAIVTIPVIADTQTTTLTTTVPAAEYTMTVPETLDIPFGALKKGIGKVAVEAVSGFNTGKNVQVTVTHDDLAAEGKSTKIPYTLTAAYSGNSSTDASLFIDNETDNVLLFKSTSDMKLHVIDDKGKIFDLFPLLYHRNIPKN